MSSVLERENNIREEPFRMVEDIEELPNGIHIPLSSIFTDFARSGLPPAPEDLFGISKTVLDSLPSDISLAIRGSSLNYQSLRLRGVERRGTLSIAISEYLAESIKYNDRTRTAFILNGLVNASDLDFFLPETSPSEFEDINSTTINNLRRAAGIPLLSGKRSPQRETFLTKFMVKLPTKGPYERGRRLVKFDIEKDTVVGIPYCEIVALSDDDKKLLTMFWTPGKLEDREIMDTRRDPRYALSWDVYSRGEVTRNITAEVEKKAIKAGAKKAKLNEEWEKRLVHENGTFSSSDFSTPRQDIWINVSQENLRKLAQPIEVGTKFEKLDITMKMKLALRAVQKGVMVEDILALTPEGKEALKTRKAPAISEAAIAAFRAIPVEEFTEQYKNLKVEEKAQMLKEVMESMLTGLFYPSKFIEYAKEAGIFKFFPQLAQITEEEWDRISERLPEHEKYAENQYTASHFHETGIKSRFLSHEYFLPTATSNKHLYKIDENKGKFINPYFMFVRAIQQEVPDLANKGRNYFEKMDLLLDLEEKTTFGKKDKEDSVLAEVPKETDFDEILKRLDSSINFHEKIKRISERVKVVSFGVGGIGLPAGILAHYINTQTGGIIALPSPVPYISGKDLVLFYGFAATWGGMMSGIAAKIFAESCGHNIESFRQKLKELTEKEKKRRPLG